MRTITHAWPLHVGIAFCLCYPFTEVTVRNDLKTPEDLNRFVSEMYTKAWDPQLPLWRAYVINGLDDGRLEVGF